MNKSRNAREGRFLGRTLRGYHFKGSPYSNTGRWVAVVYHYRGRLGQIYLDKDEADGRLPKPKLNRVRKDIGV